MLFSHAPSNALLSRDRIQSLFAMSALISIGMVLLKHWQELTLIFLICWLILSAMQVLHAYYVGESLTPDEPSPVEIFKDDSWILEQDLPQVEESLECCEEQEEIGMFLRVATPGSEKEMLIVDEHQALDALRGLGSRMQWRQLCVHLNQQGASLRGYSKLSSASQRADFLCRHRVPLNMIVQAKLALLSSQSA